MITNYIYFSFKTTYMICLKLVYSDSGANFGVNPFLYMIISGASELPAPIATIPRIAKIGRRLTVTWCFFFCGGAIASLSFIPKNDSEYCVNSTHCQVWTQTYRYLALLHLWRSYCILFICS